jgi:hypothetical protein
MFSKQILSFSQPSQPQNQIHWSFESMVPEIFKDESEGKVEFPLFAIAR